MSEQSAEEAEGPDLEAVLAALRRDYSKLGPRIRELQHEVLCECSGVSLRLHFPAFRQGKTTVHELVELAWLHLTPFALTRKEIDAVRALQSTLPFDDFLVKTTQLNDAAAKLFIKAHKATNRNGEAGELLLYLLTEWILSAKVAQGPDVARTLIPLHPRESEAFQSYADVLELCHEIILGIDTSKSLHRFHALIARRWMLGLPLPQIIDEQISRNAAKPVRTTIRNTLDLIEGDIRFQAVRLFGCYSALLVYALDSAGLVDMVSSIPSLPLYLEIGASDKTMISFISLGLSRVTAMKLNEMSARKDLDTAGALQWLRTRPLDALGLSPLLLAEVRAIATVSSPN